MMAKPFTASLFLKKSLKLDVLTGTSFFIVGVDGGISGLWFLLFELPYPPDGFCSPGSSFPFDELRLPAPGALSSTEN